MSRLLKNKFLYFIIPFVFCWYQGFCQNNDEVNFRVDNETGIKDTDIYDSIFFSLEDAVKAPLRVSELSLEGKGLKSFPMVVLSFKNIHTLNISYNHIDSIPANLFDKCRKLRVLQYAGNDLNELSSVLFHPSLRVLDVAENNLTVIPDGISQCRQLEELDVHANQLTACPPSSVVLESLKSLILSGNPLDVMDPWILNQPQLKILFIDHTKIESLPESLCKVSTLRFLNIEEDNIKELPLCFCEMKKIKVILLSGSALSEDKLKELNLCLPELEIR
jgi:leucine-rich repeat protein SHOC2